MSDDLLHHEFKIAEGLYESKAQYCKIVQAGISQWVQGKGKTVEDLKKLIELDLALQRDDF